MIIQRTSQKIYFVKCEKNADRNKWLQALTFLREQSIKETKPMEFEVFSAINEAQKKDELFDFDKQDYDFEHVTINKKQKKNKKKFDLDNLNIDGENQQEKPAEIQNQAPSGGPTQGETQSEIQPVAGSKQTQDPQGACELSDEMLSESDDEDEETPPIMSKQDYKVASQEKPMDTFKSLYSEFKEFIPESIKPKGEKSEGTEAVDSRPRNVSFLNKAKGFFGL
jgi:hypothetical protein